VSSSSSNSSLSKKIFESDYAMIFAVIIGLALIGKGIYEIYRAYSGKFQEDVESAQLDHKAESLVLKAGKIGFTARGIVAGILGFLFLKVAYNETTAKLSKTDVFSFIEQEFGSIVMGIVALGLAAYGVFMIIKSKYSSLSVRSS
ncbi:MAG: DUF1206 domain-containing protein, partial [Flavobacteriaceae bacterium]|nr:DUF1206 domain-containing protein [Flavobacteriaceae bacterium]